MKRIFVTLFAIACLLPCFAQESTVTTDSVPHKYTFGDFFDALDLPTVVGGSFCPNGIEGGAFNSAMRLGWRHHKNYGTYAFIAYDAHSRSYDSLCVNSTNVTSGEVWYHTISLGVGYRIPLVKDIRAFYEHPYFHAWDFFFAIDPGLDIAIVKNVEDIGGIKYANNENNENNGTNFNNADNYRTLTNSTSYAATLRFSAGVEWFIFSNFGVFAEAAYTQHLTPTVIDQAAINQGLIKHPSGSLTFSIGLSLFFN